VISSLRERLEYILTSLSRNYFLLLAICMQLINIGYQRSWLIEVCVFVVVCVFIFFYKLGTLKLFGIFIICLIVIGVNYYKFRDSDAHIKNYVNEEYKIIGEVVHYPFVKNGKKVFDIQPSYLKNKAGEIVKINDGLIQAKAFKYSEYKKGDIISFEGFIEEPENFDDFDYKAYLEVYDIYGIVAMPYNIQVLDNVNNKFENVIADIRGFFVTTIRSNYPEPHASLLLGMLIGTRESFTDEFDGYLKNTGTTHIIAVSGFNVTIVVSNTLLLAGLLPKKVVVYFASVMLISFIMLVGIDNLPAMRAVVMGGISLVGVMVGRKSNISALLSLTFIIFVLFNPLIYKSLSFQLSFASTVGLIVVSPIILEKMDLEKLSNIKEEFATSASAIFITFPITFATFGGVSLISIVANILLAGLITPIMLFGFLGTLSSFLNDCIGLFFNMIAWSIVDLMVKVITYLGSLEYAYVVFDQYLRQIALVWLIVMAIVVFESKYHNAKLL